MDHLADIERAEEGTMYLRVVVPADVSQVDVIDAMDDVPAEIYVIPNDEPGALADATADARAQSWNDVDTLRAFLDALERGRAIVARGQS
jgi:hypothetical protein